MLCREFYDHKTAVLMHQDALRTILAEHGVDASNLTVYEMVPLLRHIGVDLSFITATAADIKKGKLSVDSAGNKITGTLDLSVVTARKSDVRKGKVYVDSVGNPIDGTLDLDVITATAADILEGKVSVDRDGNKLTGTLVPETGIDVSDTTATAPDVLDGKKFYNSAGVLTTGTFVPQSGGGGSTDFFKCAEVGPAESGDTDSGSTSEMPEPVFYASLASADSRFTTSGSVNYTTVDGVPCVQISDASGYLYADNVNTPSGAAPRSICFRANWSDNNYNVDFAGYGGNDKNARFMGALTSDNVNELMLDAAGNNYVKTSVNTLDTWYFIVYTYDGTTLRCYVDGELKAEASVELNTENTGRILIGHFNDTYYLKNGYLADFSLYNVALSASQVQKLYDPNYEPLEPFTWNGYKAVLTGGYYTFEETLTKGLTYGKGFTPEVDKVYDGEAMVKIASLYTSYPTPDLHFPLNSLTEQTTGAQMTNYGVTFTNKAAVFEWGDYLSLPYEVCNKFSNAKSVMWTCFYKLTDDSHATYSRMMEVGSPHFEMTINNSDNYPFGGWRKSNGSEGSNGGCGALPKNKWNFCAIYQKEGGIVRGFGNGTMIVRDPYEAQFRTGTVSSGYIGHSQYGYFEGEMANMKMWFNLDLTEEEFESYCNMLMREFNPEG